MSFNPEEIKEKVLKTVNELLDTLDAKLNQYPQVVHVAKQITLRPAYLVVAATFFTAMFVLFGYGAAAFTNLLGFGYPIYGSYQALRTPCIEDDRQWLTYWVAYGFFNLAESFDDILAQYIPVYHLTKAIFLLWLQWPTIRGAELVYNRFIVPLMGPAENRIDRGISTAKRFSKQVQEDFKGDAESLAKEAQKQAISAAVESQFDKSD